MEKARNQLEYVLNNAKQVEDKKVAVQKKLAELDEREDDFDDFDMQNEGFSTMPNEVREMLEKRMDETGNSKNYDGYEPSDIYLQEFKKSFLAAESRNAANRANKTMQNRAIDDNEIADAIDYDAKSDDDLRASFG